MSPAKSVGAGAGVRGYNKQARGFRQFLLRGVKKVRAE